MIGFDLDGTLLDYAQRVPAQVNTALLDRFDFNGSMVIIATNQGGLAHHLAGHSRPNGPLFPSVETFAARYRAIMKELQARGAALINMRVCTYHPNVDGRFASRAALELNEIFKYDHSFICSDHEYWRKPEGAMLGSCTLFFGDDIESDAGAARNAGVAFFLVERFMGVDV